MLLLHVTEQTGSLIYLLPENQGAILGRLFDRQSHLAVNKNQLRTRSQVSDRIAHTRGHCLSELYWGRYVAFLRGTDGGRYVLRDPTGAVPCFMLRTGSVAIFFSHFEDIHPSVSGTLSIDWRHIATFLQFDRVVSRSTGFKEIQQVLAGECFQVEQASSSPAFYWNPISIWHNRPTRNIAEYRAAIKHAVRVSVHSWTSVYRTVLHELSGGLDSSIVLSCLASSPSRPQTICFNLFSEVPEADERFFARKAASRANCELIETVYRSSGKSLQQMLCNTRIATPLYASFNSECEDVRAHIAHERKIEAIFSGQGGDHLFHRRMNSLLAADYVRDHGLSQKSLSLMADIGRATGKPMSFVLRTSLSFGLLRKTFDPYAEFKPASFMTAALGTCETESLVHPWIKEGVNLPPAKLQQIFDIIDCQNFYAMICTYADIVHPLISQPIMECSLETPTYILASHGRERSLVRDAFAEEVPYEIIARTSKGGGTNYFQTLLIDNAPFMREFLLDGMLVEHGLLDRHLLERALSPQSLISGNQLGPIVMSLVAESWARKAIQESRRNAA